MGLPVDEPGPEVEVGLEEIVLDHVGVLAGDQLEDLLGGVQIPSAVRPRTRPPMTSDGEVDRYRRGAGGPEELEVERRVGGRLDVVLDAGRDDGGVALVESLVAMKASLCAPQASCPRSWLVRSKPVKSGKTPLPAPSRLFGFT